MLSDIILLRATPSAVGLNITDGWKLFMVVDGGVFAVQALGWVKSPTVPALMILFIHVPLL
jgi:hypothetical protein